MFSAAAPTTMLAALEMTMGKRFCCLFSLSVPLLLVTSNLLVYDYKQCRIPSAIVLSENTENW